jgi:hypothetical protein
MERLILLRDFDHWFRQLPLRLPGISRQQFEPLRVRITEALSALCQVEAFELDTLREMTNRKRSSDEFVLTLDGGTYFKEYDFSFAMTRAVTRLSDVERGRMIRVAREGFGQFWTQVAMLRREYEESGKTTIVICDDGIDTGKSLSEVVRQLMAQYLEVGGLRVLLNPHAISELEGVAVESIVPPEVSLWTHERDLFWGSPGGGVSLISGNNVNQLCGIPYSLTSSLTSSLLKKRLGLAADSLSELRNELLIVNREFWNLLSRAAGRPLRLRDAKRLIWAKDLNSDFSDKTEIVHVIDWLLTHEPVLA